jgi:hypothetical protein
MQRHQRKGKPAPRAVETRVDPLVALTPDRLELGPTGRHINHRQARPEEALARFPPMRHQSGLHLPWRGRVPVAKRPEGNLRFERRDRPALGGRTPAQRAAVRCQQAIDRRRAELEQQRPHVRLQTHLAVPFQRREEVRKEGDQPLGA